MDDTEEDTDVELVSNPDDIEKSNNALVVREPRKSKSKKQGGWFGFGRKS